MYKDYGPEINEFYNVDISLLKQILGEKLHYHVAVGNVDSINPFDQAVIDIYPYFKPRSKVLDCGSGWGGPGRMLKEDLNCDVTEVTVSTYQAEYSQKFFPTIVGNLNCWQPTEYYDIALFMESYTHMTPQALLNIKDHVKILVMKDTLTIGDSFDIPHWYSKIRTKEMFCNEIEAAGFKIKELKIQPFNFAKTAEYWNNNLLKLNIDKLPKHIQLLKDYCTDYKRYPIKYDNRLRSITIYATKI